MEPRTLSKFDWTGTQAELDARISAFIEAKKAHAFTVDIPAPREDEVIEKCAALVEQGETILAESGFPDPLAPKSEAELAAEQAAAVEKMTPAQRRMYEYRIQGVLGDAATLAIVTNDAAGIAAIQVKKAAIDFQFPIEPKIADDKFSADHHIS